MKKLQPKTIKERKRKAFHEYEKTKIRVMGEMNKADEVLRSTVFHLIKRCPHSNTRLCSGQYLPCVEVCNICGAEKGFGNSEFKLNWS